MRGLIAVAAILASSAKKAVRAQMSVVGSTVERPNIRTTFTPPLPARTLSRLQAR